MACGQMCLLPTEIPVYHTHIINTRYIYVVLINDMIRIKSAPLFFWLSSMNVSVTAAQATKLRENIFSMKTMCVSRYAFRQCEQASKIRVIGCAKPRGRHSEIDTKQKYILYIHV